MQKYYSRTKELFKIVKKVNDMPLGTYQEAKKPKELRESLTGKEYEIIEYYKSGEYYVRRKPKREGSNP
jgi:hypothetical protein